MLSRLSSAAAIVKAKRSSADLGTPASGGGGGGEEGEPSPGRSPGKKGKKPASWEIEQEEKVAWIHTNKGSGFFALVVVSNSVFIGIDCDLRAKHGSDHSGASIMLVVEIIYLLIFTLEAILRLISDRCPGYIKDPWNGLDAMLVVFGIIDVGIALSAEDGASEYAWLASFRMLKNVRMFRMLRMLRVFKVVRLIRLLRELILLGTAILGALRSLAWVGLMFVLICYMGSVLITEFLGIPNKDDELLQMWFGDLGKSFFTLIQMTTLEGWSTIARHVSSEVGELWVVFILAYVIITNSVLLNVALAVLIEKIFDLTAQAKDPNAEDAPSWMNTPRSDEASDDEEDKKVDQEGTLITGGGGGGGGPQQSVADRIALQALSELFDVASTNIGQEGVDQRKLVTVRSLKKSLDRQDVQAKLEQAIPAFKGMVPETMAQRVFDLCPVRNDKDGLNRNELSESCMVIRGEMSMNHLVVISQSLQAMEKAVTHELVHINKHQRRLNRRFLKLRHRLRKVYHFDGAPRKMVALVNEIKHQQRKRVAERALEGGSDDEGDGEGGGEDEVSEDIELGSSEENDW